MTASTDISPRQQARLDREAAAWIARLAATSCSDDDKVRFDAWRDRSPAHADAFHRASEAWDDLGLAARALPAAASAKRRPTRRRAFITAGAAALGVGGVAVWSVAAAQTYETGVGERRRIALKAGVIELDALSRVSVRRGGADVSVERGRACFDVQGPGLTARVGGCALTVERALFEAECVDDRLSHLLLLQGQGLLRGRRAGGREALMAPSLLEGRTMALSRPDAELLERLTSWRSGRVVFSDDTLAEAVAVMNRYDARQLRLQSGLPAGLRVSGMFQVGDNRRFAETLSAFLPIAVRTDGDDLLLAPPR